jgi:hypothetical protein
MFVMYACKNALGWKFGRHTGTNVSLCLQGGQFKQQQIQTCLSLHIVAQ